MIHSFLFLLALGAAEERAIAFLSREVPAWPAENQCFSCHNNGDAARALFAAKRAGYSVPSESTRVTVEWLADPAAWSDQKGADAFSDEALARIQFASALLDAIDVGLVEDESTLDRAAALVASDQKPDGSWKLDVSASIGSPATYGTFLATAVARRVLAAADAKRFAGELEGADRFLRDVEVKTVLAAAAVLSGLVGAEDTAAIAQRERCLELISQGQAPSGGWGPYVTSAAEPFDTAVVVLALARLGGHEEKVKAGRRYLLETQIADGSWPETTRPAGQISYAQYISTTGWALLALVETE
ncbi:MAG: hypothetical protein E2P02_27100 [Acidobacteria bacterium]|nr:MAG: hypothetical protein E2P02_27100 [Acidobacteriota bacterium]